MLLTLGMNSSLGELGLFLLTQEAHIEKSKKEVTESRALNLTQGFSPSNNLQTRDNNDLDGFDYQNHIPRGNGYIFCSIDFCGGRFIGCGSHNGNRNYAQCHICHKIGHEGSYFYYCHTSYPYGNY